MRPLVQFLLVLSLARPAAASDLEALRTGDWLAGALAEYLAALIAEDEAGLHAFVTTWRDDTSLARTPADARVARQLQFRGMLGAVELVAIPQQDDDVVVALVRSPVTEGYFEIFVEASTEQERRIGSMGIRPGQAPSEEAVGLDDATSLQDVVERMLGPSRAPAIAAAVLRADGELETAVAGVRRVTGSDAVEVDEPFHIGSVTKPMTASVALRLHAAGVVDLEAPMADVLTDVEIHASFASVTLADLLAHRAGVDALTQGEPDREQAWRDAGEDVPAQRSALVRDVLGSAPDIAPGTAFSYSNGGYAVAAAVMAAASGRAWEDLVVEHVFEALGLDSAHLGWPRLQSPDGVHGHFVVGENRLLAIGDYTITGPLAPAGDVSMNMADLVAFGAAHLRALDGDDAWLDPELAARMHTPADGSAQGYGWGWSIGRVGDRVVHQHNGSAGTYFVTLTLEPATGRVVAVAFNDGALAHQAHADRIVAWALARTD
jgi:D-alanyl-D-alanine carboxypeptidase